MSTPQIEWTETPDGTWEPKCIEPTLENQRIWAGQEMEFSDNPSKLSSWNAQTLKSIEWSQPNKASFPFSTTYSYTYRYCRPIAPPREEPPKFGSDEDFEEWARKPDSEKWIVQNGYTITQCNNPNYTYKLSDLIEGEKEPEMREMTIEERQYWLLERLNEVSNDQYSDFPLVPVEPQEGE